MPRETVPSTEMVKLPSMQCPRCGALEIEWRDGRLQGYVAAFKVDDWSWCRKCKHEWPADKARFVTVELPANWTKML
jgi:predicted Zn-ribbon and HTH transcriptional regulator